MALPKPVSRADMYLSYLNYTKGLTLDDLPTPVSRSDMYLYNLCVNRGIGGGSGGSNVTLNGEPQTNFNFIGDKGNAIKELHTTDSTGKTSISRFASNEDHVEMATGRTLREEYMGVLKTMGKEFVSADGSPVEANNGIEARVISGEIKGQTVKVISKDGNTQLKLGGNNPRTAKYILGGLIEANKQYHITTICTSQSGNPDLWFSGFGPSPSPKVKTGINKDIVTFTTVSSNLNLTIALGQSDFDAGKTFEGYLIISENGFVENPLSFGLHSTQAAINNNNQNYEIYEPQILGKTRILNGQLVSLEPSDLSLPKLGSVPSMSDTLDLASRVATLNTKEVVYNGNDEVWVKGTVYGKTFYEIAISDMSIDKINSVCDKFPVLTAFSVVDDFKYGHHYTTNKTLRILDESSSIDLFKAKLQSNPITVRYQLAEPSTIQLTGKQIKAYDAYKKVISLPFAEDKVTLNEDGSVVWNNYTEEFNLLNPSSPITFTKSGDVQANTTRWYISSTSFRDVIMGGYCSSMVWSNAIKNVDYVCTGTVGNTNLQFRIPNSVTTSDEVYAYLLENNLLGDYKLRLKTPLVIMIDKSLIPTITTNKTNILEAGGAVKPSSFKVTLPVDRIAEIEARLQALESTTVDVVLNK